MNRIDFIYLFDVKDANPNGDPDAGNLPRVDPETGQGLVTDVCLKRKIRNYVGIKYGNKPPYEIYFTEGAVLNLTHKRAYEELHLEPNQKNVSAALAAANQVRGIMTRDFYDIRTFGAVMTTQVNCGQVRGPVQVSFARSVDPIVAAEHSITRNSVTKEEDKSKERTMGRKFTVPYGLYRVNGFINPFLAEQTGFSDGDLELLWESLINAFQFDQSAARPAGSMSPRKLILFLHSTQLGNALSHKLFELVTINRISLDRPPRDYSDYEVQINWDNLPEGVTLIEKL